MRMLAPRGDDANEIFPVDNCDGGDAVVSLGVDTVSVTVLVSGVVFVDSPIVALLTGIVDIVSAGTGVFTGGSMSAPVIMGTVVEFVVFCPLTEPGKRNNAIITRIMIRIRVFFMIQALLSLH